MGLQDALKTAVKKVTLELIYEVVDERTGEISQRLDRVERDLKELDQKIDKRFDALNSRIDGLYQLFAESLRHTKP
ncbi:MAG: hypothetical protein AAB368_17700 [bacterium]